MSTILSFDLDGTLIKRSYADAVWLQGLPQLYATEKNMSFSAAKEFLLHEYDQVSDAREEWYDIQHWFERFGLKRSWQELLENYRHVIEPFPETVDVVERLSKEWQLIILSNAKKDFIDVELEQTNLGRYFSHVFSSTSDFHKVKKVPEFYSMVCERLEVKPEDIIHVGDHEEYDYLVPKQLGIKAFYLDRTRPSPENDIITNLKQFEDKINDFDYH